MAAFLVTGNLGSGKSTLAQELSRQGLATIDPDCDPMLSYWEDDGGTPVPKTEDPAAPDEQWLRAHRWVWNRSLLQDLVNQEPGPVFGSGIALNIDQVLDLLTRVFVLRIDAATQQERPHSRSGCSHTTRATRMDVVRRPASRFETAVISLRHKCSNSAQSKNCVNGRCCRSATRFRLGA